MPRRYCCAAAQILSAVGCMVSRPPSHQSRGLIHLTFLKTHNTASAYSEHRRIHPGSRRHAARSPLRGVIGGPTKSQSLEPKWFEKNNADTFPLRQIHIDPTSRFLGNAG